MISTFSFSRFPDNKIVATTYPKKQNSSHNCSYFSPFDMFPHTEKTTSATRSGKHPEVQKWLRIKAFQASPYVLLVIKTTVST